MGGPLAGKRKKKDLPTSRAWVEEVLFVECPECDESVELGEGVIIGNDGFEQQCDECGLVFRVLPKELD